MKTIATILVAIAITTTGFAQTNDSEMELRLKAIVIPEIQFRDASVLDALTFLFVASTCDLKADDRVPHLSLVQTNTPQTRTNYTYEFEDGTPLDVPSLTAQYRQTSVYDAIVSITKQLGLTFNFENNEFALFKDGKRIQRKKPVESPGRAYLSPEAGSKPAHP